MKGGIKRGLMWFINVNNNVMGGKGDKFDHNVIKVIFRMDKRTQNKLLKQQALLKERISAFSTSKGKDNVNKVIKSINKRKPKYEDTEIGRNGEDERDGKRFKTSNLTNCGVPFRSSGVKLVEKNIKIKGEAKGEGKVEGGGDRKEGKVRIYSGALGSERNELPNAAMYDKPTLYSSLCSSPFALSSPRAQAVRPSYP